jgi:hypothetical protein
MPEEITTVVRIPLSEIEESVRMKHDLPKILREAKLEETCLVLYFTDEPVSGEEEIDSVSSVQPIHRKRRAHRRRNRMRTRGWEIVDRIVNSKGQKCTIYKPFVEALENKELTTEEQLSIVGKILKSNRNRPSETSIHYFLDNTLEFLRLKFARPSLNSQNSSNA